MLPSAFLLITLLGCSRERQPVTVHIATLNDFHGALYETPGREAGTALGGLPVLVGALDQLRDEHPDLLVLDGGDVFQGSWPVNATLGMGAVTAFDLMGVHAAAVGNHEFDYGGSDGHPLRGALEAAAAAARFQWLSANITEEDGSTWSPPGSSRWTLIERGEATLGLIGLSTTTPPQTTLKRNVADLHFADVVDTLAEVVPEVRAAGADAVIVLGHLTGGCRAPALGEPDPGCEPDGELGRLLTELPEGFVDVIVVGHTHTLINQRFGQTWVLEQRSRGQLIGRLDLVIDAEGVNQQDTQLIAPWVLKHRAVDPGCVDGAHPLAPLDVQGRTVTPSAAAVRLVEELELRTGSLCDRVGCAERALVRDSRKESEVGNLVADAMLAAFPDVDVAITNSGGLRADLPAGELIRKHLHAVMPFNNRLVLLAMSGEALRTAIRVGASGAQGVMQVAGGRYHFDPTRTGGSDLDDDGELEGWETDRLCTAHADGEPIDPERTYRVATTDFLVAGGDHMGHALANGRELVQGPMLRDAIIAYVAGRTACLGAGPEASDPSRPRVYSGPCDASDLPRERRLR